ncbi:MAG: PAS domain-containing protein, partial [Candidatus Latescibacterota bacterium]
MLGYAADELVGRPVAALYADTPHGKEEALRQVARFRAGETIADEELQMQKADGTPVWISLTVNAVRDARGQIVESRSVAVDITERRRTEEILRQNRDYLRALLNGIHDHIVVIDENYRITEINQSFSAATGYAREDAIGSFCYTVSHGVSEPCTGSDHLCPYREVLATGGTSQATHVHRGRDGATQYVDIVASPPE